MNNRSLIIFCLTSLFLFDTYQIYGMDKLTQEEECTAINQSQSANESDTNNDSDDYVLVGSLPRDNTEERRINREHYINLLTKPHFLATSHHKKKQKQQKVGHTLRQRAPFQLSLIIPKN